MEPIETVIAQGESETLEFKPSFNQDVIETAAAFANTRGGRIVIGVSNFGVPLGSSHTPSQKAPFRSRWGNGSRGSSEGCRSSSQKEFQNSSLNTGFENGTDRNDHSRQTDQSVAEIPSDRKGERVFEREEMKLESGGRALGAFYKIMDHSHPTGFKKV